MATKKAASKKTAGDSRTATGATTGAATTAAAKKTAATKTAATKAADTSATHAAQKAKPSHHDISVQAYLLWERDGGKHGHHDHYWHQAERELAR